MSDSKKNLPTFMGRLKVTLWFDSPVRAKTFEEALEIAKATDLVDLLEPVKGVELCDAEIVLEGVFKL